jgi:hypothetical protein
MFTNRKLVGQKIQSFVVSRWSDQEFMGRASGYRYCFTRSFCSDPVPTYLHLVVRHHRRKEQILGYWDVSYFQRHRPSKGLPAGVSLSTQPVVLQADDPEGWEAFYRELSEADIDSLLEKLPEDRVEMYLWNAFQNTGHSGMPPEYASVVKDIVAQEGYNMTEPTQIKVSSFLQDYVPEDSEKEAGKFTLEASRARQKLASFQLTDPQSFVVHLISGAVAGGAEVVEVYIDSDDIIVEFGGEPLTRPDLEGLFSNLLSGKASAQGRELAVALNAASSLKPKLLILESWRDGQGMVLEVDSEKESVQDMDDPPEGWGHRVHFRDRPSLKVMKRFLNSLKEDHPEIDMIGRRCSLAPVKIYLEGKGDCRSFRRWAESCLSLLWTHPDHPLAPLDPGIDCLREESPVDASVLLIAGPKSGLTCLIHGVKYDPPESVELHGLYAVVCNNFATRDLSMTSLVADDRWEELKSHLLRGRDKLLKEMARRYENMDDEQREEWAPTLRYAAVQGARQFASLPLYPRLDGSFSERVTVLNQSPIRYTERIWEHGLRSGKPVYVLDHTSRRLIGEANYQDVDDELKSSQTYFRKYAEWIARKPLDEIRAVHNDGPSLKLKDGQGEVVLGQSPLADPVLCLHCLNRSLKYQHFETLPPGVRVIVNNDGLEVSDDWTRVLENRALRDVRKQARAAVRDFFEMLMEEAGQHSDYVLNYLLYLKSMNQNWRKYASRVRFKSRLSGTVTLDEVLVQTHSSGKPLEELWEGSKRLMKTLAVPMGQLLMIQELKE